MTITDLISIEDIDKWRPNDIITITAGTGKGKSYFVKNKLYDYARNNNKKILFLVHRVNCFDQFMHELLLEDKNDVITLKTYQSIEWHELSLDEYDYIISDESHYFLSDATFNNTTEISLESILESDAIKIFMSATSNNINNFLKRELKLNTIDYKVNTKYDFIDSINIFRDDLSIHQHMKEILNKNEKAIVFIQSATKALEIHQRYKKDSLFNCSSSNALSKYVNQEAITNMLKKERFEEHFLITTTALDAGVSIKDKGVKHIILDIKDIDSLIQCVGRKRLANKEKISIYVKYITNYEAYGRIRLAHSNIERANYLLEYGSKQYIEKYGRDIDKNGIVYDRNYKKKAYKEVNKLMYHKQLNDIKDFEKVKETNYIDYISSLFNFPNPVVTEKINKEKEIELYLKSQLNKYMLKPKDREELIKVMNIRSNNNNRILKSLKTINSVLEETESSYKIVEFRKTIVNSEGKKCRYNSIWKIIRK